MNFEEIERKHKKIIEVATDYMKSIEDSEHNVHHMYDVVNYTKELLNVLGDTVNNDVCIIAAYWHDVGRIKENIGHEKLSSDMLREEMHKYSYDDKMIEECCQAVEYHRWDMIPKTREGLLIKDADKLSWLGSGRWKSCIDQKQSLDSIIHLLPKLKSDILHFEESKRIYDRDIVNLIKILYEEIYKVSNYL